MKLCETYLSIQGEGKNIGTTTFFIRFHGCNLDCKWCDTRYAKEEFYEATLDEIILEVDYSGARYVCVTGGEPLLQKETIDLVKMLLSKRYKIVLETNGTQSIKELYNIKRRKNLCIAMDVKCPSSGMDGKFLRDNINHLREWDELKFVIGSENDLRYATQFLKRYKRHTEIVFQPVWGYDIKIIINWILENKIDCRVLPQLHKIIWGDVRGR